MFSNRIRAARDRAQDVLASGSVVCWLAPMTALAPNHFRQKRIFDVGLRGGCGFARDNFQSFVQGIRGHGSLRAV
jgi:hypothetical protein